MAKNKNKLSLAETHPELAKEWHPTKNLPLTPRQITSFNEQSEYIVTPRGIEPRLPG
jgi:hypothetical protein